MKANKVQAVLALTMMCLVPFTQARAEVTSLDSAIQQFQYTMTVQWDQKDQTVRQQAITTFTGQIVALEKAGVSKEEILEAIKTKVLDAQTAKDIDSLISIAKEKNLSQAEMQNLAIGYIKKTQQQGASWSSEATLTVVLVGLLVGLVVVALLTTPSGSGSGLGGYYYSPYYDPTYYNSCYFDSWGNYYCY